MNNSRYCSEVIEFHLLKSSYQKNAENHNKMTHGSNVDGRDSIFEPIATQLIAEWYGWNKSSLAALEESQEATLEEMRLGYPQRTIHLANEYNMEMKTWNIENHLKVKVSKNKKYSKH